MSERWRFWAIFWTTFWQILIDIFQELSLGSARKAQKRVHHVYLRDIFRAKINFSDHTERTDCQEERFEAHSYNYRNFSTSHYEEIFEPMCEPNGLYSAVQNNNSHAWCVDMITGDTIQSTVSNVKDGIPECPGNGE